MPATASRGVYCGLLKKFVFAIAGGGVSLPPRSVYFYVRLLYCVNVYGRAKLSRVKGC